MPTFFIIDGIKIDFYYNDHLPPHFHAVYAEFEELVEIKTLKAIKGKLPPKQHKKMIQWAKQNQAILLEIWESMRS